MLKPPCPPGSKPVASKDTPEVYSSQEAQDWYVQSHGRQTPVAESGIDKFKEVSAHILGGLTRQYAHLPQGGTYQRVRHAIDQLHRVAKTAEYKALTMMQDAYFGLNREERHHLGGVLLARDLAEEVKIQRERLTVEEQSKLDARKVRITELSNRTRDEMMDRIRQEGKDLERRKALLEKQAPRLSATIERLKKKLGDAEGAKAKKLARRRLRAAELEAQKSATKIKSIEKQIAHKKETAPKRMEALDAADANRQAKAEAQFKKRLEAREVKLPKGLTPEIVESMVADADKFLAENPKVKKAYEARRAYLTKITDERKSLQMELFGFAPDLSREDYVHHEVLREAQKMASAVGGKKVQATLSAFYTQARKGSTLSYNTNFYEAEHRVLTRMTADILRLRALKAIKDHDISARVMAAARAAGEKDGAKFVPDGYVVWRPKDGTAITQFWPLAERSAERLEQAMYDRAGLTEGQNKQDLYLSGMQNWVIPKEIAATLDAIVRPIDLSWKADVSRWLVRAPSKLWKLWTLYKPESFLKYEMGNVTGDTHAAYLYTPVRRWPNLTRQFLTRSWPEVWGHYFNKNKRVSPEYREFLSRYGEDSHQLRDDLGIEKVEGNRLQQIKAAILAEPTIARRFVIGALNVGTEPFRWVLNGQLRFDGMRERLWRYATYLDAIDDMRKSPDGRPSHYGNSIPDEVLAYDDIYDRAYHLQNETFIAYEKTTEAGRWIAEHLSPFWRYQEGNHKRAYRYFVNQMRPTDARKRGEALAARMGFAGKVTALGAVRVGLFFAKLTALEAALMAWNNARYPDLEESLSEDIRQRPHLILGYDEETGRVRYLRKLGAIPDFYALLGLFDNANVARQWLDGQITREDAVKLMLKKTAQSAEESLAPTFAARDLLLGIRRMKGETVPVRDKVDAGIGLIFGQRAQSWYRSWRQIPQSNWSPAKLLAAEGDAEEMAYYTMLDHLGDFQRSRGEESSKHGGFTEKGNNLYWWRKAIQYGDKKLADKYALAYLGTGGKPEDYKKTVETMSPLGKLPPLVVEKWVASMTAAEKRNLRRALQHYADLFATGYKVPKTLATAADFINEEKSIIGSSQLKSLEPGGLASTYLTTPGMIEQNISRDLKKKGLQ